MSIDPRHQARRHDAARSQRSILVVSENPAFSQCISSVFEEDGRADVTAETTTFGHMNGHGAELIGRHDAVVFEADPSDEAELRSISELIAESPDAPPFIALAKNDVTLREAERLREAGVQDVLPLSISGQDLNAVLARSLGTRREPARPEPKNLAPTILVGQARGGIGATTCAVNLAVLLANRKRILRKGNARRVALVDLDLQFGNTNEYLDVDGDSALLEIVETGAVPEIAKLKELMLSHASGVDVLRAPAPIAPLTSIDPSAVSRLLGLLRAEYDLVVVDLPRAMVDWIEPAVDVATRMLLLTDTTVPSIRHAKRSIDFVREINIGLPIEVVVNKEAKPLFKSEQQREAQKVLDRRLDHWVPLNIQAARAAADLGQPVVELQPRSNIAQALRKLASDLETHLPEELLVNA